MRVLAVIVMILGLAMMSAPLVLPRLGVSFAASSSEAAPVRPAEGAGTAGIVARVTQGIGSAAAFLGMGGSGAANSVPAGAAADLGAACEALSGGAPCATGATGDFAATFGKAAGMIASGQLPADAKAALPGAAPAASDTSQARASGGTLVDSVKRPTRGGAKFVKARSPVIEDKAP